MKKVQVAVVGSINMDLVVGCRNMPAPGETVLGHSFTTMPGGKGANQAVAAARLGQAVKMLGCVGDDEFGAELRRGLEDEGIATEFLITKTNTASGVAFIQVDEQGENAITVVPGANGRLQPSDIQRMKTTILSAAVVLIQLEIPVPTVIAAIDLCRQAGVKIILDPAPVPEAFPDELYRVDVLSPNQHEAESLTGVTVQDRAGARQAAIMLQDRGAREVVIKMGADGALVLNDRRESFMVASYPTKAIDTTAAGDAFTAALGVGIAQRMTLEKAARLGCAAGSLAVRKHGAQDAMPTWSEVVALVNED